ncbi:MAG: carbohydrate ABC transporter permease [Armatimonadota bacterium]|nr:carbohydrate ABC transporter permease [Armatimonadota bacterium]
MSDKKSINSGLKMHKRTKKRKELVRKVILHTVLLIGSAVFILPFIWLVTTSLKEEDQIFKYPPVWIPTRQIKVKINNNEYPVSEWMGKRVAELGETEDGRVKIMILQDDSSTGKTMLVERSALKKVRAFGLKWENYTDALRYLPEETNKGLLYLWNTVYVTILSIVGTLLSSSLVAFSFARLRWPGRDTLFLVLLATMMLPGAVTMVPVFLVFRALNWVDTLKPLWTPAFFGGAFSVFLLRQFFMTIPLDLEDAAKIDGCSYFGIYWQIMLPLIKPALAALTIMTFMSSWNNFMGPLIYINSPEKMTLSYGLQLFQGAHGAEYALLMAASTLVMLPVLIVFFFTQRYFIQGITLTGLKA